LRWGQRHRSRAGTTALRHRFAPTKRWLGAWRTRFNSRRLHPDFLNQLAVSWAANSGAKVGNGWNANFKQVFASGNGVTYAVTSAGDLLWYRHYGLNDGTFTWAANSVANVGNGWNFKHLFSGGDGVIYAVNAATDLIWYRHDGSGDGTYRWASNSGAKVATAGASSTVDVAAAARGEVHATEDVFVAGDIVVLEPATLVGVVVDAGPGGAWCRRRSGRSLQKFSLHRRAPNFARALSRKTQ
jgi:hypothetical protein